MTCNRRTGPETITFDSNELFETASCVPRSSSGGEHPYRVVWGIVDLGYPVFNFRGEYDKLDEYDEQVGREPISDTGIMRMEVRMRQGEKQRGQQEDDDV